MLTWHPELAHGMNPVAPNLLCGSFGFFPGGVGHQVPWADELGGWLVVLMIVSFLLGSGEVKQTHAPGTCRPHPHGVHPDRQQTHPHHREVDQPHGDNADGHNPHGHNSDADHSHRHDPDGHGSKRSNANGKAFRFAAAMGWSRVRGSAHPAEMFAIDPS